MGDRWDLNAGVNYHASEVDVAIYMHAYRRAYRTKEAWVIDD